MIDPLFTVYKIGFCILWNVCKSFGKIRKWGEKERNMLRHSAKIKNEKKVLLAGHSVVTASKWIVKMCRSLCIKYIIGHSSLDRE